jgi:hypothetical protein
VVTQAAAALAAALNTNDPNALTTWLDTRVTALVQGGGEAVEIQAAELVRAYVPELQNGAAADVAVAAKILAMVDGTELAIYLGEFTARMYAHAFGPDGLEQAKAALQSFATPLLPDEPGSAPPRGRP